MTTSERSDIPAEGVNRVLTTRGGYYLPFGLDDTRELLCTTPFANLHQIAKNISERRFGKAVEPCAVIRISNHCGHNCNHCHLRFQNEELPRYRMVPDDIVVTAKDAIATGIKTVVLTSGQDLAYTSRMIYQIIQRIKNLGPVQLFLSMGERQAEEVMQWREAGADGYLLNFDSCSPQVFNFLRPDQSVHSRLDTLNILRENGLRLASGPLIGLPGQQLEDLAEDLLFWEETQADLLVFSAFRPHPMTPMGFHHMPSPQFLARVMATARILYPEADFFLSDMHSISPDELIPLLECGVTHLAFDATPEEYNYAFLEGLTSSSYHTFSNRLMRVRQLVAESNYKLMLSFSA